ncbi:MAG: hypothetical protein HYS32_03220 [Candidatus Woesearchaeota archaeon]|nr:MAG: hypothetical protein HYS32_03220 [Candidatus Woesearchaeota archaeon]
MTKKRDHEDISRSTVLILVFLAIFISILGTWTVLSALDDASKVSPQKLPEQQITAGTIGLYIEDHSQNKEVNTKENG